MLGDLRGVYWYLGRGGVILRCGVSSDVVRGGLVLIVGWDTWKVWCVVGGVGGGLGRGRFEDRE